MHNILKSIKIEEIELSKYRVKMSNALNNKVKLKI